MKLKKWLAPITDAQYDWIKETASGLELRGAGGVIIREALDRVMQDKSFKRNLEQLQAKVELQALEEEKAEMAERESALKRKLKVDVTA